MQVKNHPVKAQAPDQPGSIILAKEPVLKVCLLLELQIIIIYFPYNITSQFLVIAILQHNSHICTLRCSVLWVNVMWLSSLNSSFFLSKANFARAVASLSKAQAKKIARFLPNPESHWGPKLRAGRQITTKHISLLGPEAVNGHLNRETSEEPTAKRPKTGDTNDPTSSS